MRKKTDSFAVTALILSFTGIFTWGISWIVALPMASAAKRNIKAHPDQLEGRGVAIAAQVISITSLILTALVIVLIVALTRDP